MGEEDLLGALPLLLSGRDLRGLKLPLPEVRRRVDDDPWDATAEVDNLLNVLGFTNIDGEQGRCTRTS